MTDEVVPESNEPLNPRARVVAARRRARQAPL